MTGSDVVIFYAGPRQYIDEYEEILSPALYFSHDQMCSRFNS